MDRQYIAIDLKSFYASVECMDRKLDPMRTNLVVADPERTEKTICLAVSPSLKAYGISGRARLFEVVQRVKEVNSERSRKARAAGLQMSGSSADAEELKANPSLEVSYVVAPPRMLLYEQISTRIFSIYLQFVSSEDVHVYSIDECFIDVTGYLKTYECSARELAVRMIREVLKETGITATAGVGTNLYLAKVAMDIMAKHVPADRDGVRIAELNEQTYRESLWCHRPLTDFWRVGRGTVKRLEHLGCYTMGDVARLSRTNEDALYHAMGVNAELLIDHAWGWEPTEISAIKAYKPETTSLSSGQVLSEPYDREMAKLIVREMTEAMALDLVRKELVTRQVVLTLHYDRTSIQPGNPLKGSGKAAWIVTKTGRPYTGEVGTDYYGRSCPKHAHGTGNLDRWTSSSGRIVQAMMDLFDRIADPDLTVRRIGIAVCDLIPEEEIPAEGPVQLDFFTDPMETERKKQAEAAADAKERKLQLATLAVHGKYGKNALLKAMNLQEGATARQRNSFIGGHRAGDPQCGKIAGLVLSRNERAPQCGVATIEAADHRAGDPQCGENEDGKGGSA